MEYQEDVRYVAVDLIAKGNKVYLTDNIDLTDDVFDAKSFRSIQDCQYFIDTNGLKRRVKPISLTYLLKNLCGWSVKPIGHKVPMG